MIPIQVRVSSSSASLRCRRCSDGRVFSIAIADIMRGVDALILALNKVPQSIKDRVLVLPMAFIGCLAAHPEKRQMVLSRLANRDEAIGNISSVRLLIERVWNLRALHGNAVDWCDVLLNDMRVHLLLV